jgi:Leucine-rich repeat (LRR) protein
MPHEVLSPEAWSKLLMLYRSLELPLPPADAPLIAKFHEMEEVEDREFDRPLGRAWYLLGFQVPATRPEEKSRLLIGTQYRDVTDTDSASLKRLRAGEELPSNVTLVSDADPFPINTGLPTAIQCFALGRTTQANELYRRQLTKSCGEPDSLFFQPEQQEPEVALRLIAWARNANRLATAGTDRAKLVQQMQVLQEHEPTLQTPMHTRWLETLVESLRPSTFAPGTTERLIDELLDLTDLYWDDRFALGDPQQVRELKQRGWDGVPALLLHLRDRRPTRVVSQPLTKSSRRFVTVGELIGRIVVELAGDASHPWQRDPQGEFLDDKSVQKWWSSVRGQDEESYLIQSVVPSLPKVTSLYNAMLVRIQHRYPQRLPEVYVQSLKQRADISTIDILSIINNQPLPAAETLALLKQGTEHDNLARQREALEMLASLDLAEFERQLMSCLRRMPTSSEGPYRACEQGWLAQLAVRTAHRGVWYEVRDATRRVDVGVRLEVLGRLSQQTDLPKAQEAKLRDLLSTFLEDSTVRDAFSAPEQYANAAGERWPQLAVRDWAAYLLAKRYAIDVSSYYLNRATTSEQWRDLRLRVAQERLERNETDKPTSELREEAQRQLRDLGVLLLETDNGVDGPRLTRALCARTEIRDEHMRWFRALPEVRELDLSYTKITDQGVAELSKRAYLSNLNLSNTRITDRGVEPLAKFLGLERLVLSDTQVTDRGVGKLVGNIHLTELNLDQTQITGAALESLTKLLSLESLSLAGTKIMETSLASVPRMPKLTYLNLLATDVSDAGLARLSACRKLESVTLSLTKVTDAGLPHLASLPQLQRLYLFGQPITDHGLATIGGFGSLTHLSLAGAKISDQGVKSLRQLAQLEMLSLAGTSISDEAIEHLNALARLTNLDLSGTAITDRSTVAISKLASLRSLTVLQTQLSETALQRLRQANSKLMISH